MSQKTHTHLDSLERPGKLDGPLWLSARQVFSRERTWAFSIPPWRHATCLSPVPHLSHWVSWRSSQQFFLLIALLSHHSKAVWTAQQFPLQASNRAREKEQELPTEAPGCPLPSYPHLSWVPTALLFPQKRVLWQKTSPVLLALKIFLQSQSNTIKRKGSHFSSVFS